MAIRSRLGEIMPTTDLEIEFRDDEAFRNAIVAEENPDPIGGVRIRVTDQYLIGSEEHYLSTWVTDFISRIVESGIAVLEGEGREIVNHDGPTYLLVEPVASDQVRLSYRLIYEAVENPAEYPELVEEAIVDRDAFVTAVARDGEQLLETIHDYNPDLRDHEMISVLEENIRSLKEKRD